MSEPARENVALTNDKGNAPVCHRSRDCEVKNDTRSWVFPLLRDVTRAHFPLHRVSLRD